MELKIPQIGRPQHTYYRKCGLGIDLPASFIYDLRGIDDNLYPVWHPYKMLWDDIINEYAGEIEDPRYQIHHNYGELNFGFVLTDGKGCPVEEGLWHIWRWCSPVGGWAHVINIDSADSGYLNILVKRLWLQAQYNDRYGHRGYSQLMEQLDQEEREKKQAERQDLMNEISKANSSMLNRVSENLGRGLTKPTNPMHESVISYPGQKNRSRIVRPADDKEGGLVLPEGI